MRSQRFAWAAPDRDGICAAQTLGASGALTINGALMDLDYFNRTGLRRGLLGASQERTVSLYSSGDLSGVNFTVTGVDTHGQAVTETIAGPNNTTVYTSKFFAIVTDISANGAVGTAVEAGSGTTGTSSVFVPDLYANPCTIAAMMVVVSGTVNYTLQHTPDDVFAAGYKQSGGNWKDHADVASETTGQDGNYAFCPNGIRWKVNSSTDGVLLGAINQSGL